MDKDDLDWPTTKQADQTLVVTRNKRNAKRINRLIQMRDVEPAEDAVNAKLILELALRGSRIQVTDINARHGAVCDKKTPQRKEETTAPSFLALLAYKRYETSSSLRKKNFAAPVTEHKAKRTGTPMKEKGKWSKRKGREGKRARNPKCTKPLFLIETWHLNHCGLKPLWQKVHVQIHYFYPIFAQAKV